MSIKLFDEIPKWRRPINTEIIPSQSNYGNELDLIPDPHNEVSDPLARAGTRTAAELGATNEPC